MKKIAIFAFLASLSLAQPVEGATQPSRDDLKALGIQSTREIKNDICFPATSDEYVAMGKNAILMLEASSVISSELPLRSVYVVSKGVRFPLPRIATFPKHPQGSDYTAQTYFYLLPLHFMKKDAQILADFTGDRKAFGITRFYQKIGIESGAPAFVRLDEYDTDSEADPEVLTSILAREYPSYFK
jgi:hypothetical protein